MDSFGLEVGAQLLPDGSYRPVVGSGGLVFWEAGTTHDSHSAAVNAADLTVRRALASLLSQHEANVE